MPSASIALASSLSRSRPQVSARIDIDAERKLVRLVDAKALEDLATWFHDALELHISFKEGGHERRHHRIEIGGPRTMRMSGELRLVLAREMREDARAQRRPRSRGACSSFIMRDPRPGEHACQPGSASRVVGRRARSPRRPRAGRCRRDRPRRRRCRPGRACRPENRSGRHWRCAAPITPSRNAPSRARSAPMAKQLLPRVGEAPVAPGEEAREIGLEIAPRNTPPSMSMLVQQQHAPVPQRRLALARARRNARRCRARRSSRERPGPRRERKLEPLDARSTAACAGSAGRHASIVPSVTTTASPPIEARVELAAPHRDRELDQARPAHLVALLDHERCSPSAQAGMRARCSPAKAAAAEPVAGSSAMPMRRREHAGMEIVARLGGLAAEQRSMRRGRRRRRSSERARIGARACRSPRARAPART